MTTADLLAMAGAISKDTSNNDYSADNKYRMLSAGQEAIVNMIDARYLDLLKKLKSHTSISSPGTFTLETDYLKPAFFSLSDGTTEVEYVELENKGDLWNNIDGGTDLKPVWFSYMNASNVLTGKLLATTYPVTSSEQFYIRKPPTLSASQEPILIGFDSAIIAYFKHFFHLAEGQADLAQASYQTFLTIVTPFMPIQAQIQRDK